MALFEITKAQVKSILFDYIREDCSSDDFNKLVMSILKEAKQWESFDWYSVKELSSKMYNKQGGDVW